MLATDGPLTVEREYADVEELLAREFPDEALGWRICWDIYGE
jgi:hypothetical protein